MPEIDRGRKVTMVEVTGTGVVDAVGEELGPAEPFTLLLCDALLNGR